MKKITLVNLFFGLFIYGYAQEPPTSIPLLDFETDQSHMFDVEWWQPGWVEGDGVVDNPYKEEGNMSAKVMKITGDSKGFKVMDPDGIFDFEGDTWLEYDIYCDYDLEVAGNPWYTEDVYLFSGGAGEDNNRTQEPMWGGKDKKWFHIKTPIFSKQSWFKEGTTYNELKVLSWCAGAENKRVVYYDNLVLKNGDYDYVEDANGISQVQNNVDIKISNGKISVSGYGDLKIYSTIGHCVESTCVKDSYIKDLDNGIYIVTWNNKATKVVIK